ncbi:MAG: alpha-galactosidase [Deltaproteobacteria bacterium]|nr:alpha-galactosidase [Deltaproteobacteria bacterium]
MEKGSLLYNKRKSYLIRYHKNGREILFSGSIEDFPAHEENRDLQFNLDIKDEQDYSIIKSSITNSSSVELKIDILRPLIFSLDISKRELASYRFFFNGFQSFSGTGSFSLNEREKDTRLPALRVLHNNTALPKNKKRGWFTSDMVGVLYSLKKDHGACIGFLDSTHFFTQVGTEIKDGRLILYTQVQTDNILLKPFSTIKLPPIYLSQGNDCSLMLEVWADLLARRMNVENITPKKDGWCSWYYYFAHIDEDELIKNLEVIKVDKKTFNIDIFELDDGYQEAIGDWTETNNKFRSSLKDISLKIKDADLMPGVWTAPFMVRKNSSIFKKNPDWILKDKYLRPVVSLWNPNWGIFGKTYALDITHTGVQEYIKDLFFTLTYEYGFEFLKIDFLYAGCLPGIRHDPSLTLAEVMRFGLALIRKSCKPQTLILGCGCPLGPAIGMVDTMRIGNDVTPYWSGFVSDFLGQGFEQLSTKNCIRNTLTRTLMQKKWWLNDPDCLIVRKVNNKLTYPEIITLSTVIALSGGPLMLSDNLGSLDDKQKELIQKALYLSREVSEHSFRYYCPDIMINQIPEIQVAQGNDKTFIGVYNFRGHAKHKVYDLRHVNLPGPKTRVVNDFWTGAPASIEDGILRAGILESHACRLFIIENTSV